MASCPGKDGAFTFTSLACNQNERVEMIAVRPSARRGCQFKQNEDRTRLGPPQAAAEPMNPANAMPPPDVGGENNEGMGVCALLL